MTQLIFNDTIGCGFWNTLARKHSPTVAGEGTSEQPACSFVSSALHPTRARSTIMRLNATSPGAFLSARCGRTRARRHCSAVRHVRMAKASTSGKRARPAAAERLATDIERAELLLQRCVFRVRGGAAEMARGRGVDMERLGEAYGGVIAESVRKNVGERVDKEAFVESFMAGGKGARRCGVEALVFESWIGMMGGDGGKGEVEEVGGKELGMLSRAYGWSVGRSVWLTGFEWDVDIVGKAVREGLEDGSKGRTMGEVEYNGMFDIVADCAATVMGTQKMEDAELFFAILRAEEGVEDLQGDGYVLGMRGQYRNEDEGAIEVQGESAVKFGLRIRLLDGKALYVPKFDGGVQNDLEGRVEEMPTGLGSILTGMKEGESRTAFFHPYAAAEILEMVMSFDELPGQTGVVVDVFLNDIQQ